MRPFCVQFKAKKSILRYERSEGEFIFYKNGREVSLIEWNEALNEIYSMRNLEKHPNLLIRGIEANRRKKLLKLIAPSQTDVIADIGCEEGYISGELVDKCHRLYCVDIDRKVLDLAEKRIGGKRAVFLRSDAQALRLEDDSCDIVICSEVLEHLPEPAKGLRELVRITKPGGKIVISVPNESLVLVAKKVVKTLGLNVFLGDLNEDLAVGHLHVFNRKLLQKLCQKYTMIENLSYDVPFFFRVFAVLRPIKT